MDSATFETIEDIQHALHGQLYIADHGLSTSIFLAIKLRRPLFLEGEAGVGKTEVAKVLATMLNTDLIRLQCYEGLDIHQSVYEWNYTRQMMHIRVMEAQGEKIEEADLFGPEFLMRRPLLQAIENSRKMPPVLLVDEIDRSDEEFEAYLLEVLSDYQITIPEIGTIKASKPPVVVITSNRTREVHDALKRRCLYYWIDYPSFDKEMQIVRTKVPQASANLARQVTTFVQELRKLDLYKVPGVAETLDWIAALVALDKKALNPTVVQDTLGVILKYQDDIEKVSGKNIDHMLERMINGE
jgi:MoxR-like ATPase